MLVLARSVGEKVIVTIGGETLTICVVNKDRHKVRLGFEGPPAFKINRKEIQDQIDEGIPRKTEIARMKDDGCPH